MPNWVAAGVGAIQVVGGALSGNTQSRAARAATNAQVGAANDQLDLDRSIYQDRRAMLAPQIQLGAEAQARRMLMLGYSPDQVRQYLSSTRTSLTGSGGADVLSGGTGADTPAARIPGSRVWNEAAGEWAPAMQAAQPSAAPVAGADDGWIDQWDPQAFLESTPGYDFRRRSGELALQHRFAAAGKIGSGAYDKAAIRYNQDYASGEWGNLFDQYGRLAGEGRNAAGTAISIGGDFADSAGRAFGAAGDARYSGFLRQGEAAADSYANIAQGLGTIYGVGKQQKWFG